MKVACAHCRLSEDALVEKKKIVLGNSRLFGAKTKILVLLNSGAQASFFFIHQKLHGFGFPRHFSVGIIGHN